MTLNSEREEKIASKVISDISDDTLITGGHFILDGNSPKLLNEGTLESFSLAVSIYKRLKDTKKVQLGILLNDIGQTCGTESCLIGTESKLDRDSYSFPDEYLSVLNKEGIEPTEIHIFWEKHMRNRGKKLFHKIKDTYKSQISQEGNDIYFTLKNGDKMILLRGNPKDQYGTPACPLIMAAYAFEQNKVSNTESFNIYFIDTENIQNIPNHLVIEKGALLAHELGCLMKVKNLYITNTEIIKNYQ